MPMRTTARGSSRTLTARSKVDIWSSEMRTHTYTTVCSLLMLLLGGCSKDPQPSSSEIQQALTSTLPAFAQVSSFTVQAIQNMGTQVEPVWQSRFRATVTVTSPTFASDGTDSGVVFVRSIKRAGESTELFGKSASTLYGGQWRTQLDLEGGQTAIAALGQPESVFGPQRVIIRGSNAESSYVSEQAEKRRLAIIASQREAEEQRVAGERAGEERLKMRRAASERLRSLLTVGAVFNGIQQLGNKKSGLRLKVLSFDSATGAFSAQDEWLNEKTNQFGPPNRVVGNILADTLYFTETVLNDESGALKRGYTLRFTLQLEASSARLVGGWTADGFRRGDKAWFDLK